MLLLEMLVVLGVFPLPAFLAALIDFTNQVVSGSSHASHADVLVPGSPALSVVIGVVTALSQLAGAALVVYLLSRSGETTSSIGLDRRKWRADAAMIVVVFLVAYVAGQVFLGGLVEAVLRAKPFPVHDPVKDLTLLPVFLVSALTAGPIEEIVVLGYLVRRLEQLGVRPGWVVVIAVAVRASYHIYYGPGIIPILFWATASVLLYTWLRRLWPFIIVHSIWDASLFLGQAFSGWVTVGILGCLVIAGIIWAIMWWPRRVPRIAVRAGYGGMPPPWSI